MEAVNSNCQIFCGIAETIMSIEFLWDDPQAPAWTVLLASYHSTPHGAEVFIRSLSLGFHLQTPCFGCIPHLSLLFIITALSCHLHRHLSCSSNMLTLNLSPDFRKIDPYCLSSCVSCAISTSSAT